MRSSLCRTLSSEVLRPIPRRTLPPPEELEQLPWLVLVRLQSLPQVLLQALLLVPRQP